MPKDISPQTRGEINRIKDYLRREYIKGGNPPEDILEWQNRWFPNKTYLEIYSIIRMASIDLAEESGGRIQFRYNVIQDKWRFHEGLDDYLMIHFGTQRRIEGHMNRQNVDWGYSNVLIPEIKNEILIIEAPILNVGKTKVLDLKQRYSPS